MDEIRKYIDITDEANLVIYLHSDLWTYSIYSQHWSSSLNQCGSPRPNSASAFQHRTSILEILGVGGRGWDHRLTFYRALGLLFKVALQGNWNLLNSMEKSGVLFSRETEVRHVNIQMVPQLMMVWLKIFKFTMVWSNVHSVETVLWVLNVTLFLGWWYAVQYSLVLLNRTASSSSRAAMGSWGSATNTLRQPVCAHTTILFFTSSTVLNKLHKKFSTLL